MLGDLWRTDRRRVSGKRLFTRQLGKMFFKKLGLGGTRGLCQGFTEPSIASLSYSKTNDNLKDAVCFPHFQYKKKLRFLFIKSLKNPIRLETRWRVISDNLTCLDFFLNLSCSISICISIWKDDTYICRICIELGFVEGSWPWPRDH